MQRRQLIKLEIKFGLHALRGAVLAASNTAAAPYLLHDQCVCVCGTVPGVCSVTLVLHSRLKRYCLVNRSMS